MADRDDVFHIPVLKEEVLEWLEPVLSKPAVMVDCTLGFAGHTESLLSKFPEIRVIGLDVDDYALEASRDLLRGHRSRVELKKANFAQIDAVLEEFGLEKVDAFLFDLGISSFQVDRAFRGFRFTGSGPLDMRMDPQATLRAADVVNGYSQRDLAHVISRYGEERFASRIARAIVERRASRPFEEAADLAEVVKVAIPAATRRTGPHPARRTFQALRIEVNDEMGSLGKGLNQAVHALGVGGRIAVISYHSLEDRTAKRTFSEYARGCVCPRDLPVCACGVEAELRVLTRKPIRPSEEEMSHNPRSDSARMRVAQKLGKTD